MLVIRMFSVSPGRASVSPSRITCLALVVFILGLGGCQTRGDRETVRSTIYDSVPCEELIAFRDELKARHPVAPPEREEQRPLTAFVFLKFVDLRSSEVQQAAVAHGKIRAAEDSIRRRAC